MLWLALAIPFIWWHVAIWRLYFEKRVQILGTFEKQPAPIEPKMPSFMVRQ